MFESPSTVKSIFGQALDIGSPAERAKYLDLACQGNVELRAEVEGLIEAVSRAGNFLGAASADLTPLYADVAAEVGSLIGPYKLLEQIGEGGMGLVYMAEQQQPVRRRVALKIIKPGMDTRQVMARFEAERQALAMMDHANIAKVLDAGTTHVGQASPDKLTNERSCQAQPDLHYGRPYFVMELVKGIPITRYCDDRQLTVKERLNLFVPVCQAIQHAHQKGIIHRDIKPSNILVAMHDEAAVPKVIDFGVAKATAQQLTEKTVFTGFGQLIGTLEYMSPEQAQFNQLDIDTRSDIYSLGVLLYELLTGATPFDQAHLRTLAFEETLRIIREVEPPKPSTRLSTSETLATIAASRSAEPIQLNRQIKGDLDWIVMTCLEKDRSRRYQTANGLAMDLRRYLDHQPVVACPPSRAYLWRKFVQRNRGPVVSALLLVLALVGGIIGTTWGMLYAQRAREDAEAAEVAEARRAEGERQAKEEAQKRLAQIENATEILTAVFADLDPESAEMEGVELRALLARRMSEAAQQLEGEVVGDPLVVASLQHALGDSLQRLGELRQAEAVLIKARQTRQRLLDADNLDTAATKLQLAMVYRSQAKYDLAEELFQEVLETRTRKLGPDHLDTLTSKQHLAMLYHSQTKLDFAETLLKEVLERRIARLGADHSETLTSQHRLAMVYGSQGSYDLAETLCKEVRKRRAGSLGADHLDTLASKQLLALLYRSQEKFAPAEALYQEVLALRTAKLGPDHPDTIFTRHQLAILYGSMKAFDRSIPLLEETLKLRKAKYDADHPATIATQADLAAIYCDVGRFNDAIPLLEEAHQKGRRDSYLVWVGGKLLTAYLRENKRAQATALMAEQVRAAREQCAADSIELAAALEAIGWALLDGKAYADAESLLRESGSIVDRSAHEPWQPHRARLLLGVALVGQQKFDEAEPLLIEAYAGIREDEARMPREANLQLTQTLEWLVQLYEAAGQLDGADEWRKKLRERAR